MEGEKRCSGAREWPMSAVRQLPAPMHTPSKNTRGVRKCAWVCRVAFGTSGKKEERPQLGAFFFLVKQSMAKMNLKMRKQKNHYTFRTSSKINLRQIVAFS